ncbi:RNA-directed DNA polymerase [Sphingomonas sp. SORGH_AS_0879]|uniref:RNA-directed DNA polymerase n=1 Tax=Sphingomonas sp. SORGH_AS_0879 TaxID=3041790 RepID=UPI00278323BD|nr:RNA-directed DNA polymerase [Sphingomonas sp. SORGH_AS_0879]MDQ1231406.1 hypothetical protein [Sphingomonas sp. SORGH_AS_0879]
MDKEARLKILIGRGYFPKELPPPFTTQRFSDKLDQIIPLLSAHEAGLNAQQRRAYPPLSRFARFNMARKGHSRRMLGVPNPINQYYISDLIAEHQDKLENLSGLSNLSLTTVNIVEGDGRAVAMPKISRLGEIRIKAYSTTKVILQTDVLSFYHTIYTHSIPWALHTKKVGKRNRRLDDPTVYGNKLDLLMRSCQDGQTVGIPVGPDTSRIISEIILLAIESLIPTKVMEGLKGGYRYMDDFFLCFDSHVDAETFLAALRESVLEFDLQLNADKTRIIDSLEFNEETWPGDIAQMKISSGTDQRRDLMRFFTEIVRLSKTWPDESIASYSIRKTSRISIMRQNWEIYESYLIRVARENSNCLDSVIKILCTYAAIGYEISDRVQKFAEYMIEAHAPYNNHYEVVWTLWLCRSLELKLSAKATALVARVENSMCACLVFMLRARGLLTGRGAISDWMSPVEAQDLHGEHWLLIYEAAIRKSWRLPGAAEAVEASPLFQILRDSGVSFFDASATNLALELPGIASRLRSSLKGRRYAVLPGAIYVENDDSGRPRRYEKLGEDYGSQDSDWTSGFNLFELGDDDDDEVPF